MSPLDLGVVALYFAVVLAIGVAAGRGQQSGTDYFLGARDMAAWPVLLSIVATETSALTVISVPGIGARGNLTFLQLAVGYLVGRIAVAAWLLPGFFRGGQETAYARLESRFGAGTRRAASLVFLATRFLGDSVRIFAGAIPLALMTGWNVPVAIVLMGGITLVYTWFGGLKAVIWSDVLQLVVYVAGGGVALVLAVRLAGGWDNAFFAAWSDRKLVLVDPTVTLTAPYTLLAGLVGGALLSAASHGVDQLIVQRLLATRSLREARLALVGSGVVVLLQFLLFLLCGIAIWAAGYGGPDVPADQIFPRFVLQHLPAGLSGLVIAGVVAAAMSTISSSISALASSMTNDLYAGWTGRREPAHLLVVGRAFSLGWGLLLIGGALAFQAFGSASGTPVVVLALSIASVTYGPLLGTYLLAGTWPRAQGRDVLLALGGTVTVMLAVLFATTLATVPGLAWLAPAGRLAWPWYVPLGVLLSLVIGIGSSLTRPIRSPA